MNRSRSSPDPRNLSANSPLRRIYASSLCGLSVWPSNRKPRGIPPPVCSPGVTTVTAHLWMCMGCTFSLFVA